jgi:hypothetical protein
MHLVSCDSALEIQLASDCTNRGIDLLNQNSAFSLPLAIRCFDESLTLLENLPPKENSRCSRLLVITWLSRGIALQRQAVSNDMWEAIECFREALAALEQHSTMTSVDRSSLRANVWACITGAVMGSHQAEVENTGSLASAPQRW